MPTSAARTERAFTLVEVLISLLIIAVLAALMGRILQGSLLSHRIQQQALDETREIRTQQNRQFAGELEEPVVFLAEETP